VLWSSDIDESFRIMLESNILEVDSGATGLEDIAATTGKELVSRASDDGIPSFDNVDIEAVEENAVDSETTLDSRVVGLGRVGVIV
jgi:hypothetical protein